MNIVKSLSNAEKRKIRDAVIRELERYRLLRGLDSLEDGQEAFCKRVEKAIEGLPSIEKFLITKRYTNQDSEYVNDFQMYNHYMDPPVSEKTYSLIRTRAMLKIALFLGLDTGVPIEI